MASSLRPKGERQGRTARLQTQFRPELIDPRLDLRIHGDDGAPRARSLAGPFISSVNTQLRAQPRHRAGEVEIVDRGGVHDDRVAFGSHARAERPDHLLPPAYVNVL